MRQFALPLEGVDEGEQEVRLAVGARHLHRVLFFGFGLFLESAAGFVEPAGSQPDAELQLVVGGTFEPQFLGAAAEAFRFFDVPGVELVFCEQFEQPDLRLAVFEAVCQADGFLEQFFSLGRVDRVEVDARLSAQGTGDAVELSALAPDGFRLAVPAEGFVEARVQAGEVSQRE